MQDEDASFAPRSLAPAGLTRNAIRAGGSTENFSAWGSKALLGKTSENAPAAVLFFLFSPAMYSHRV